MSDFLAYHTYPNPLVAQPLLTLLDAQGILYKHHYTEPRFSVITGMNMAEEFVVSLQPEDFTRVRELEEAQAATALGELPADYYLFGFSNAELWELLREPAAWSSHDVALASRLLRERGETVTEAKLRDLREQHMAALAAPAEESSGWVAAGYVLAALGGLLGVAIGWSLWHDRKTLPDGRRVATYSLTDQAHGRRIFWLGLVVLGGVLGFRAYALLF